MRYLIGISGPPRAGKDTLTQAVVAQFQARGIAAVSGALSMPMRQTVYAMMGRAYDQTHYELKKDTPQAALGGATIREAMIALSEEHVIPRYGPSFWAQAGITAADTAHPDADVLVVSDMGFDRELAVMENHFGETRCMWVQLHRPGHSFARDSRGYVGRKGRVVSFDNGCHGMDFFVAAARRVLDVAEHWGWSLTKDSHPTYTSLDVDGG